jgi:integrase
MRPDEGVQPPECRGYESTVKYTATLDDYQAGGRQGMPRKSPFLRCLAGYVEYMQNEARYAEITVKEYRWGILRCHDIIREGNGPENPVRISERDLEYLFNHLTGSTARKQFYWTAFSGFLKWCGNEAILKMRPRWPISARTHVDWLEPEQAARIRETAMKADPLIAIIMHLELDLCLRRIEIQRLRIRDVHENRLDVLGKGRFGGKPRTVSLVPGESQELIAEYLRYRLLRWGEARQDDKLIPLKRTALDNRLKELQKLAGIKFLGHHTLRRTGGRLMWLAGVPIETIASVMGHESTEMTLRYIGVNLSDQAKAFEAVRNLRVQLQKTAENVPFVAVPEV